MQTETAEPQSIQATLNARGVKNGAFEDAAKISQSIKAALRASPNWRILPDIMREALDMDANKTGRICAGDPMCHDHWHDKAGYATLVAQTLRGATEEGGGGQILTGNA